MHASYLSRLTPKRFPATLRQASKYIRQNFPSCNLLVGRGLSGAMVVPALAARMGLEWAMVRKADRSHSKLKVEISGMPADGARIVIVDDLICSGNTVKEIIKQMKSYTRPWSCEFLGGALYEDRSNDDVEGVWFMGLNNRTLYK